MTNKNEPNNLNVKAKRDPESPSVRIKTEQNIKFSVATKIILSVTLILLLLGCFMAASTILLLREDNKNYTFQSQSTETGLTGKNLVNSFQNSIDLLKLSLSLVNPTKTLSDNELTSLQSIINRQHSLIGMRVLTYSTASDKVCPLSQNWNKNELDKLSLNKDDVFLTEDEIKQNVKELVQKGQIFFNLSSADHQNIIAILTTDANPNEKNDFIPIAIGFISIDDLRRSNRASHLSVVTDNGGVLFDSDSNLSNDKKMENDPLFEISKKTDAPNGTTEYKDKNAQYLGTYNKPGFNITILAKTPLTRAMRATYIVTEKSILLGLMIIGIGIILAFILANSITAPLFYLYEATKEIAKGNFKPKLDIKSKDEIGSLSKSFTSMSEEIDNLIKQKVKSIHLEKEVEVASAVQQTLIPDQAYESDKLKIFSHYQSASQCGGDLWNHFEYQNKAVMMIADATGHGIPSALITASARSCMSVIQQLIEDKTIVNFTAADILKVANRVIQDASKGKIYMTMFVAIIDFDSEKINYSNAGHNPPWLFRESSKPMTLMIPSSRLGENPVAKFENKEVAFLPDDLLFMYTDGLLEGTNLKKEQFGKKEVRRIIEEQLKNPNPNFKEPKSIVMTLISRFLSFSGQQNGKPKALDDDITIVMTKLKGGSNE